MVFTRRTQTLVAALTVAISLAACAPPVAPAATSAPAATPAPAAPAKAAMPSPTAAPTAPARPSPAPAASPVPTASAAGGPSISDLLARAGQAGEYSFTSRITTAGQTMTTKSYVKPNKMRQEMSAAGQNVVMLIDQSQKVAYSVMVDQKIAMKMDYSQAASQVENPTDLVGALDSGSSRLVGTETVDGKSAAVYEMDSPSGQSKMWIWAERGLPLKIQSNSPQGAVLIEFVDYQFGSQPDSLFELPAGVQVMDIPVPALPVKP